MLYLFLIIEQIKAMYPIFDDICKKMRNYVTLKLEQKSYTFDVREVSVTIIYNLANNELYRAFIKEPT